MKEPFSRFLKNTPLLSSIAIVSLLVIGVGGYKYYYLSENFKQKVSETNELNATLSQVKTQNENLLSELNQFKNAGDSFAGEIASITNTVSDLAKINQIDPQLLQLYSKVFFLNEHYVPQELFLIDPKYTYNKQEEYFHTRALPFLLKMLDDARSSGIQLEVISAYRSFETQVSLKSIYKVTYGAGTANQFSADQGYSEHQLGTAVDLTTPAIADTFSGFSKTTAYEWLINHAFEYGFVISYPKNNNYYQFEPWHWRFVGIKLATTLHDEQKYLYDLDQREINKYLINFFDQK